MSTPPDASNPAARLRRAEARLDQAIAERRAAFERWTAQPHPTDSATDAFFRAEADYEAAHSEYLVALADAQHAYDEAEAARLRREQRPVRE